LHTYRVCSTCNSVLGDSVDAALCNHVLIVLRRAQLKLSGNSDYVPDALGALLGTGVLVDDPTKKVQITTNAETGKPELRMRYHATETQLGEGVIQRQIVIDAKDAGQLGTIVQRERKRAGFEPLSEKELQAQVATILANGVQTIEKPKLRHHPQVDLAKFRKGLLKIVYELAFIWLGDSYLDDPMAAKLRDVILSRSDEQAAGLRGSIDFGSESVPVRFWAQEKDCHIAYCLVTGNDVGVCVKIFDIFSAVITVSEHKNSYFGKGIENSDMHFIHLDPVSGKKRESSLAEELLRLCNPAKLE
jgi:hypothetical protein